MATYTVTSLNWNSAAFWSGITESAGGHTLDFSALGAGYTVTFNETLGEITLSDGATLFRIGDTGAAGGPYDATLGGATLVEYFDTVIGSAAGVTITSGTGDESVASGDGADILYDGAGNDTLDAGTGDDTVYAAGGNDSIVAGDGNDVIFVGDNDGVDTVEGGAGQDTLHVGFTAGAEIILTGSGAGTYSDNGATGSGTFTGIEVIDATGAADSINAGADMVGLEIFADGGDDTVIGGSGNDTLIGEAGNDSIELGGGADMAVGGTGIDTITGVDGADFISLGEGDESVAATGGNNTILGGAGNDTLSSDTGADQLQGGLGDDVLTASGGDDTIGGGTGADSIAAGDGADLVVGGSGRDTIDGGAGNDTIYGDDADTGPFAGTLSSFSFATISANGDTGTGTIGQFAVYDNVGTTDQGVVIQARITVIDADDPGIDLTFGTNVVYLNASGEAVSGTGVSLSIEFFDQATGEPVQINGAFTFQDIDTSAESVTAYSSDVDSVSVSSSPATNLTVTDTGEQITAASDATSSGDFDQNHWAQFTYTNQHELVFVITSRGVGTNYSVSDTPFTNPPTTIATSAESQDDSVLAGAGDDLVYGIDGNDTLLGGDGSDTLEGGAGNDSLLGEAGDDLLQFRSESGDDIVVGGETGETAGDTLELISTNGLGFNVLYSGNEAGTATNDLTKVTFSEIETVTVTEFDDTVDAFVSTQAVDVSALGGDDSVIGSTAADTISGDAGNDTLRGGFGADTISGGTGNDQIYGNEDGDSLSGGDGSDSLYGEAGNDYVDGGTGDDTVEGNEGDDTLVGGDGNDWMRGSFDNDILYGGAGDDYLWGGWGDDTFVIENGFGNDTVDAEGVDETTGDVLDLSAVTDDLTVDLTNADPEIGTVSDGTSTLSFNEIETITLGGGRDTLVLADGSGGDVVSAFDMTDSGDGTTNDQLDVSGLTSDGGTTPVTTDDVTVTDDGSGNAVLTFAGGEAITLMGVAPAALSSPAALESIGIPPAAPATHADLSQLIYFGNFAQLDTDEGVDGFEGSTAPIVGTTLSGSAANANVVTFSYNDADGDGNFAADHLTASVENLIVDGVASEIDEIMLATIRLTYPDGSTATTSVIAYQLVNGDFYLGDFLDRIEGETIQSMEILSLSDTSDIGPLSDFQGNATYDLDAITFVDGPVDGTAGDDVMGVGYTDAQGDIIDGADGIDDTIYGYGGNDSIIGGTGNDTIDGGAGQDTVFGGDGNDSLTGTGGYYYGGAGDDTIDVSGVTSSEGLPYIYSSGGSGNDSIIGSDSVDDYVYVTGGSDTIAGGLDGGVEGDWVNFDATGSAVSVDLDAGTASYTGGAAALSDIEHVDTGDFDDTISGSAEANFIESGAGADSVSGLGGDDILRGGDGDDTLRGGTGADRVHGQGGDDRIVLEDGFGSDTITGGETTETTGDTLDLSNLTVDTTIDLTDANAETGSVSDGTDTAGFIEIETITLGGGRDTLVLADGSGTDTVSAFDMSDSGDGTTNDQLDVSGLTSDGGTTPVTTDDVTVTDDGSGNAVLTFAGGEAITLMGVAPAALSSPAALASIGIPLPASGNFVVEGTAGADVINTGYVGDPEGDLIDNLDHSDGTNADRVVAGAGDDSIDAGLGDDTILAGDGDDEIFIDVTLDNDSIVGGEGGETQGDRINFSTVADDITITFSGAETGTLSDGTNTTTFEEIERFQMGTGNDSVTGSDGSEHIIGNFGSDTILAGGGDDTIFSGFDSDSVEGGAGNDSLVTSTGADTVAGGAGNDDIDLGIGDGESDLVILRDGDGNDTVNGFESPTDLGGGAYAGNDLLDVSGLTDLAGNPVTTEDVTVTDTVGDGSGDAILTFPNGESITLVGVPPAEVSDPAQLEAIGIPLFTGNLIVEGTAAGDLIDATYLGDPDGDLVDNGDGIGGSDGDSITAGAGDDTVLAAEGDDTILGEAGDDSLGGGAGDDSLSGGDGRDTLTSDAGADTLDGGADEDFFVLTDGFGADSITGGETGIDSDTLDTSGLTAAVSVTFSGDEAGTLTDGTDSATFAGIEVLQLGAGADSLDGGASSAGLTALGGAGSDTLTGSDGDDTLDGGADADSLTGGAGADSLTGGTGDDTLTVGSGDTALGEDGDDTFFVNAADMNGAALTITGGETGETVGDTLNVTGPATIAMTGAEAGTVTWLDGSVLTFSEIETINYTPCFTPGTLIKTAIGERDAAEITPGDIVLTRDNGYQTVRWAGAKRLTGLQLQANAALHPVRIEAGALGRGIPDRDMVVSPQHRVVMSNAAIQLLFGEDEVLVAATYLVGRPGITRICPEGGVTYVHFMFDRHELVMSDGTWTESFQPGDLSLAGLDADQRSELLTLFPDLSETSGRRGYASARMSLKAYQAQLLSDA